MTTILGHRIKILRLGNLSGWRKLVRLVFEMLKRSTLRHSHVEAFLKHPVYISLEFYAKVQARCSVS
jgi:hypothetical protein